MRSDLQNAGKGALKSYHEATKGWTHQKEPT